MIKFEVVSSYTDKNINLPKRGTSGSAGYDFEAAEDIIVPSIFKLNSYMSYNNATFTIDNAKILNKTLDIRVMVPTGIKAKMPKNMVLEIHTRSSIGSNCLLLLPNQTGIIDADYYNNTDNEGHIFIPLINLSPVDIKIKKGEKIAQGIFKHYFITSDDEANEERKGGFGSTDNEK